MHSCVSLQGRMKLETAHFPAVQGQKTKHLYVLTYNELNNEKHMITDEHHTLGPTEVNLGREIALGEILNEMTGLMGSKLMHVYTYVTKPHIST